MTLTENVTPLFVVYGGPIRGLVLITYSPVTSKQCYDSFTPFDWRVGIGRFILCLDKVLQQRERPVWYVLQMHILGVWIEIDRYPTPEQAEHAAHTLRLVAAPYPLRIVAR